MEGMKNLLAAMFVSLLLAGCDEELAKTTKALEQTKENLEEMETRVKALEDSNTKWHLKYKNAVTEYEIMADENDRLKDEIEGLRNWRNLTP